MESFGICGVESLDSTTAVFVGHRLVKVNENKL
jgi:hypothetical protein